MRCDTSDVLYLLAKEDYKSKCM